MSTYKDEKRGAWLANFRYKDWRGEPKQKLKQEFTMSAAVFAKLEAWFRKRDSIA